MASVYPGFAAAKWPLASDAEAAARAFERWPEALDEIADKTAKRAALALAAKPPGRTAFSALFGNSPHLAGLVLGDPEFALRLFAKGPDVAFAAACDLVRRDFADAGDMVVLMAGLRQFKKQAALAIAAADIAGVWPLAKITAAISTVADTALRLACRFLLREAARRDGLVLPDPADPESGSGLVVLAMGKLGAGELNYSSDIDLILLYDAERAKGPDPDELQAVFVRLARNLVKIMEARTADGYVFRTDLRLRPDPAATPLALSTLAAETYYESIGLNWERAAMIKARVAAGDAVAGARFLAAIRPFVWRKHLDFAALADIHQIKRQIQAYRGGETVALHGHDIKTGRGGIREIEFFAQTQQLVWGGRDPAFRVPATVPALEALAASGRIPPAVRDEMTECYVFLRTLEHRLQMLDDEQTQKLPTTDAEWRRLSIFMGFADEAAFADRLKRTLDSVAIAYSNLFEEPDAAAASDAAPSLMFGGPEDDPATLAALEGLGYREGAKIANAVRGWHAGRYRCTRTPRARDLLVELAPRIVEAFARTPQPDAGFVRFDRFLEKLPAGVQLFSLFQANPSLIDLAAEIMGTAPRLAEAVATHVHLLDAVLSPGFFSPPPGKAALAASLAAANAQARDFQDRLDIARRWQHELQFQICVQLLKRTLDAEAAGAALSDLADCTLASLLADCQAEFARLHGRLKGASFAVLGLGKLGGRALTATSDLDLVLVYAHPAKLEESDGAKPLSPSHYFARLASRFVSALSVATAEGALYEIDLRLRPQGAKGPLASEIGGFSDYVAGEAWTWEHMALTRARFVCGDAGLGARALASIAAARSNRKMAPAKLAAEIADMRLRMAGERRAETVWQIKDWRGGLVDVEFLVQHALLASAAKAPDAVDPHLPTAIANLKRKKLLAATDADLLHAAQALYAEIQAVLRLTLDDDLDVANAPAALKTLLAKAAGTVDFSALEAKLSRTTHDVRALLAKRLPGAI
jgi:[glutamine synthetase] adenylyltransferase / [glutamine synthetase]-adenylyl-L-tyrosine phosphorylase